MQTVFTREELIAICEQGIVPVEKWGNRDTASAQCQMGECWSLLKAGCDFQVYRGNGKIHANSIDTIEVHVFFPGFEAFEYGRDGMEGHESYYLPSPERLQSVNGGDWY